MKYQEYIKSLEAKELAQCVNELKILHKTAILPPNGKVRKIMDMIDKELETHTYSLQMAENAILEEAADRFVVIVGG